MKRNLTALLLCLLLLPAVSEAKKKEQDVRAYWCELAYKIAHPVLDHLSKGQLKAQMPIEQHKNARRESVAYLEAFGRTLCGLAPWLELGADDTEEGRQRGELIRLAHLSVRKAVDPASPDYMNFTKYAQPLVDAAFLAQAFIRSPKVLWGGLDKETQRLTIEALRSTRVIRPNQNNWLLFSAEIEAFFMMIGEPADLMRIDYALTKHEDWYKGDGIYGDGKDFHWDYYNSFVIQPMLVDIAEIMLAHKRISQSTRDRIIKRSVRYAAVLERLISPEGTFPAIGRSLGYRIGAMQNLCLTALNHRLPDGVSPAQVRCALTAVAQRMFGQKGTFTADGWLTLGFAGHQPGIAESYVCTASAYLCTVGFLHLGLPADDPFWTSPDQKWTSQKAWDGDAFSIDHAI